MKNIFSRIKQRLITAYYFSSASCLSLRGRVIIFAEILLKREKNRSPSLRIPLKQGAITLDASHLPDWGVYEEVFLKGDYVSNYENSIVIDIGAHRGIFAAFALQNGCSAIISYEPDTNNFSFLQKTISSFPDVASRSIEAYPYAVGSKSGITSFFVYDQSWSHSLLERIDRNLVQKLEVKMVDFKSIIRQARSMAGTTNKRILAKIDAEGSEYDLILNTPLEVFFEVDELFIETHSYASGDPNQIVGFLNRAGLKTTCRTPLSHEKHEMIHVVR